MIANRIKQERKRINLTQQQLAKKLQVSQQTVSKWEKGLSEPDKLSLKNLSLLFEVSTDYLLCEISERKPLSRVQKIDRINNHLDNDTIEIIRMYQKLNAAGKKKTREMIEDFLQVPKYTQSTKKGKELA